MELIGFFRQLDPENSEVFTEDIEAALHRKSQYDREVVCRYLHSGHPVFDIMEGTEDVIGKSFLVPGGSCVLSDGKFVWRADLESYVSTYGVALPGNFIEFIEMNDGRVPDAPDEQLDQIARDIRGLLGFR